MSLVVIGSAYRIFFSNLTNPAVFFEPRWYVSEHRAEPMDAGGSSALRATALRRSACVSCPCVLVRRSLFLYCGAMVCRVVGGMFSDVSVVFVDDAAAVTCWWWWCCCCCLWRSLILIRRNEDGVRWEEALEALTEATGQLDSLKTRWGSFTEACITEDPKVFFSKASPRAPFCARSCHLFCLSSSRKQARKQVGVGSRNKVHTY